MLKIRRTNQSTRGVHTSNMSLCLCPSLAPSLSSNTTRSHLMHDVSVVTGGYTGTVQSNDVGMCSVCIVRFVVNVIPIGFFNLTEAIGDEDDGSKRLNSNTKAKFLCHTNIQHIHWLARTCHSFVNFNSSFFTFPSLGQSRHTFLSLFSFTCWFPMDIFLGTISRLWRCPIRRFARTIAHCAFVHHKQMDRQTNSILQIDFWTRTRMENENLIEKWSRKRQMIAKRQ